MTYIFDSFEHNFHAIIIIIIIQPSELFTDSCGDDFRRVWLMYCISLFICEFYVQFKNFLSSKKIKIQPSLHMKQAVDFCGSSVD